MTIRHITATITAIATLGFAGTALAASRADAPVEGWSAMAGVETATLLETAQELPLSEAAVSDQPYCASDAEIAQTLKHDFSEQLIGTNGHDGLGTELWGSDQMGTWTLVAPRADGTSCIIASGIGFSDQKDMSAFYQVAGLQ